jgi:hypothetical protein
MCTWFGNTDTNIVPGRIISCIILHDLTIITCSCFQVHMNYIWYTWYHIHYHVNKIHIMFTWCEFFDINFVQVKHEFFFHVNKKLYHVLRIIMYTWWVIMFSKGIFFWWYPTHQTDGTVTRWCSTCLYSVKIRISHPISEHVQSGTTLYQRWTWSQRTRRTIVNNVANGEGGPVGSCSRWQDDVVSRTERSCLWHHTSDTRSTVTYT